MDSDIAPKPRRLADSLVFRLIAFGVVLILVALLGRILLLTSALQDGIGNVVATEQLALATYIAHDIDGKIHARRHLLENVARELPHPLLAQPGKLEAWLAERHAIAPLFSLGLMVIQSAGRGAIADFPVLDGRRQLDFAASDWLIAARDHNEFAIGRPAIGRVSGEPLIIMAMPIRNAAGHVVAVVAGTTALAAPGFLDLIQNNRIGESGGYLLVSPRDKLFVAATKPEMRLKPTPPPGVNPLHDRAMAGYRGTGVTINAQGTEELSAIASVSAAEWFVVARLPTAEAFQPVGDIRRLIVRNGIVMALGVVVALVLYLTYTFRPLLDTARRVRSMADGSAPLSPLPVARRDEIGELTEGFNYLLEKLHEREAQMAHLAHHDALTGRPNRLSFLGRLQHGTALAQRQQNKLALLFVDLDGFKPVNDTYGHDIGDLVLQRVAARLAECVRQADTVARFGGDEFVVLLSDIADRTAAGLVAQKCIDRIAEPYTVDALELQLGASIGIALFPDDADTVNALIAQADAAMYDAKRCGRCCYRFAHPGC
jgi:diguanylate cyclase (GGDEF)-like protein